MVINLYSIIIVTLCLLPFYLLNFGIDLYSVIFYIIIPFKVLILISTHMWLTSGRASTDV